MEFLSEPHAVAHRVGPVDAEVLGARLREQSQIDEPSIGVAEPLEVEARGRLWPHASQWTQIELTEISSSGARPCRKAWVATPRWKSVTSENTACICNGRI